jgi:hypothetical protein
MKMITPEFEELFKSYPHCSQEHEDVLLKPKKSNDGTSPLVTPKKNPKSYGVLAMRTPKLPVSKSGA